MWKFIRSFFADAMSKAKPGPYRPRLESLEDRAVPAALNLTAAGASASANGALFQQAPRNEAGVGAITPFALLHTHGKSHVAQGYNTNARLQYDEVGGHLFNRALKLDKVPTVTVAGVAYREFRLDITQKASAPFVSLDELRIFVGAKGNLKGYNPATKTLAGLNAAYDLDAGGDNYVKLDARLNRTSRTGDMKLLVPESVLTASGGNYVYLYSKFGATFSAKGGFEQWGVGKVTPPTTPPPPPTPPPVTTGSLSGTIFHDANNNGAFDSGESGIAGATVVLRGPDATGQLVTFTTQTDGSGRYAFGSLRPEQYIVTASQPDGYSEINGREYAQTVLVTAGMVGRGYDFGFEEGGGIFI